nr:hypothetical protein IICANGFA_00055 [Gallid alphaherpesvirus 2]
MIREKALKVDIEMKNLESTCIILILLFTIRLLIGLVLQQPPLGMIWNLINILPV